MITEISDIQELVRANFTDWKQFGEVSTQISPDGELILFKYTPKAQIDDRWNVFETLSRGLILHRPSGEVVARPFDKFHNWMQGGRFTRAPMRYVWEKVDGSLGISYFHNGKYTIATSGSFVSEQAQWATTHLKEWQIDLGIVGPNKTCLFEIVYPENRVVVDYNGKEELVLLAVRDIETGLYYNYANLREVGDTLGLRIPQVYRFNNLTEIIENCGALPATSEGYVVEFADNQRFKFKGDRYLELHRLISNLTYRNVLRAYKADKLDEYRATLPDEFVKEFDDYVTRINTEIARVIAEVKSAYGNREGSSRKEFAKWVFTNYKDISHYLFALYDGTFSIDMILDSLK